MMAAARRACVVPRPGALEAKLARLRASGAKDLQVIADFDHTLTGFVLPDGQAAPMCHDIISRSPLMPKAFHTAYDQLCADQKKGLASGTWDWEGWWTRSHDLMIEHELRRQWLPDMIRASGIPCRRGCREFFELLERHAIPALIVSAGIREVITEVLLQGGIVVDSSRVVSNEMEFDADSGLLRSFAEPPLHAHAKTTVSSRAADYFQSIRKKHVVIMGDSLTDCDCLSGVEGVEEVIRIGFFNKRRGIDRGKYEDVFDLLLTNEDFEGADDLDLSPVLELIAGVVSPSGGPNGTDGVNGSLG